MPYIDKNLRQNLDDYIAQFKGLDLTEGELNYIITCICHLWLGKQGVNYKNLNAVIGVLECAKLENYRAQVAPYEDIKEIQNGQLGILPLIHKLSVINS